MTQEPETLTIMDRVTTGAINRKRHGYYIKKQFAIIILATFICLLLITSIIIYKMTSCADQVVVNGIDRSLSTSSVAPLESKCPPAKVAQLENYSTLAPTTVYYRTVFTTQVPSTKQETVATTEVPKLTRYIRLPNTIRPIQYDLRLVTYFESHNFTFYGYVRIFIEVVQATNEIILHSQNLTIHKTVLIRNNSTNIQTNNLEFDDDKQFLIIKLDNQLNRGKYELVINFDGILNDHMQGFYKSAYVTKNMTRWIAATQFQPTDARRAFPCFDEPAMKARFRISIGRPNSMVSISNMPKANVNSEKIKIPQLPINYEWDSYQTTFPMSTYLVAFCVVDFVNISQDRVSIWARQDAIQQAEYALGIAPNILKYFEKYFAIPFPLPKIDMIALPDFAAGAMENWGLITYRETALLYQKGVSSSINKLRVASIISHELAHQWFGNLVTPFWWSDIWLNEGFATYVEYLGVDAVEPAWEVLKFIVVDDLHVVFALDSLKSSHKISVEVDRPEEISEIFDRISYAKGSSIIRMMDHFLTTDVFKSGLTNYLLSRKFSNAEQDDLWNALTEVAHKSKVLDENMSVKKIMDTWTLQVGYPVVTVTRNYEDGIAILEQSRFYQNEHFVDQNNTLWWVPITFTQFPNDFENTRVKLWMKQEKQVTLTGLDSNKWLIVNIQETGYYRVNYDLKNWLMIVENLIRNHNDIHITNKAQLINDAMNLARSSKLDYNIAMNITRYLKDERHHVPWYAGFVEFHYLNEMLLKHPDYIYLKKYLLFLMNDVFNDLGFIETENDSLLKSFLREFIIQWACILSHPTCVREAIINFSNWMADPDPEHNNPIASNLKNTFYCTAIEKGSEAEWNFAWKRFLNSNVGSEKEILLSALGCSKEVWILSRYLNWALSENSGIRKQDVPRVFASVSQNSIGQHLAFNLLRSEWSTIKKYFGSALSIINNLLKSVTFSMNTEYDLNDLTEFIRKNGEDLKVSTRTIEQIQENVESNVNWMKKNSKTIIDWLKHQNVEDVF